jgi:glycosyltransferase involved in cell wall biosynthesis
MTMPGPDPTVRVVALVTVYNEADIIGQVLEHLHEHEISFVVLDDGSQDGSIEIARGFIGRGLLEHKVVRRSVYSLRESLDCLIEMAARYSPDWILINDADEFLEPRESGATLRESIAVEDGRGFNVIQFDDFDFFLTERDRDCRERDVRKKLRFYSWVGDYHYKAWKYHPGARCGESGGHYPIFPSGTKAKVSPRKLVMRHYPFRSPQQAMRKVFKERLSRYAQEELAKGWHVQYRHFKDDPGFFVVDSGLLSEYDETGNWDMAQRFRLGPSWKSPSREELFSECVLLRLLLRYLRLLRNGYTLYFSTRTAGKFRKSMRNRPRL